MKKSDKFILKELTDDMVEILNETGKTPRQLADDNKVLLEALKELLTHALEHDLHGHFTDNAKQAIKQVTE